jgi:hypothetical protein
VVLADLETQFFLVQQILHQQQATTATSTSTPLQTCSSDLRHQALGLLA